MFPLESRLVACKNLTTNTFFLNDFPTGLEDETVDLQEDVAQFMTFSMSNELADVSRRYVENNHKMFIDAPEFMESGAGYPLSWTALHDEFCEEIDQRITEFCEERNLTVERLFELLQESMKESAVMSDYIPQFLKMFMDFDAFVSQVSVKTI